MFSEPQVGAAVWQNACLGAAAILSALIFYAQMLSGSAWRKSKLHGNLVVLDQPCCKCSRNNRRPSVAARAVGSSFGTLFRVTTFGESHGKGVGCVVDGVPPRLQISTEDIQADLDRRRPGQSRITTPRSETDTCQIYSGVSLIAGPRAWPSWCWQSDF